jgi:mannose-1-phosphate guanylyltransferase/mannose-6-phosphate isomerase
MTPLIPVILAGGAGTRLWPVSRGTRPKHLARLTGEESLLQQAARRAMGRAAPEHVVTVGAQPEDFLVKRQLGAVAPGLGAHRLLEPTGRNTAAAVALAALYAARRFSPAAAIWVCPSDHAVADPETLYGALDVALPAAAAGHLVTFGIAPTRPETGYGYIKTGAPLSANPRVLEVGRFVEKPERAAAQAMIDEGGHLWNSGMFLFRADRILAELGLHAPQILQGVEHAFAASREAPGGGFEVPEDRYAAVPAAPIDKAVMEHASRIAVVPCDPGWSDLGSWQALWEQLPKDSAGNATRGDVLLDGSERCLVHAERRLVACAGVRDLAVIETDDAILVADRNDTDAGRRLVASLRRDGRAEATAHAEEERSWGSFKILREGPGFGVREIVLAPGGRLSLPSERDGARHWIVVAGIARITMNDEILVLQANQSAQLPSGARNSVENAADAPLCIIEVQCGRPDHDDGS